MGKIIFTKRADGCLVASDKDLYQASMISEPDFDLGVEIVNASKDKTMTVFHVLEKNLPQNILYAVDHKSKKITEAVIVKLDDDSVKFIFDDESPSGTRVFVEDGDMMFSTREEALEEVTGVVKNYTEETEDKSDALKSLMTKFLDSIKEAKRRKATEEHKDDESVINEHIEHHEPTEEEKVEAVKASFQLSMSMQLAKLAARRIMLLDMINDIDREIAALNQFQKMQENGNIEIIGNLGGDDDDDD